MKTKGITFCIVLYSYCFSTVLKYKSIKISVTQLTIKYTPRKSTGPGCPQALPSVHLGINF